MQYKNTFKRYEIKYRITYKQKEELLDIMAPHMRLDSYGHSIIRNIYYDTENFRLARRSLEKPVYKEKLRIRSYCTAGSDDSVFVELKKKCRSVVYKRRLALARDTATEWIENGVLPESDSQILREIEYFRNFYGGLSAAAFLSYERDAYFSLDGSEFRVTFDDNILARRDRLSLGCEPDGIRLMDDDYLLMEIKTPFGMPLWMSNALNRLKIYSSSFSKYGTAYTKLIYLKEGDLQYAF